MTNYHIDAVKDLITPGYVNKMKTLEYYFVKKGILEHVIFNKYTIDENGVIRNEKREPMAYKKNKGGYNNVGVYDVFGKQRGILIGRAISGTFIGPPPSPAHTADHKNKNRDGDALDNIRWLDKTEQVKNRDMPETLKNAFIIVNGDEEKTANGWVEHKKNEKNPFGREYTTGVINHYAQKKHFGFSYKEYPDLPGEVWKNIVGTDGTWRISDMNRIKWITSHAENVLSGERLGMDNGYPAIRFNKKKWYCHILSFMTFFPDEYANKKPNEYVLHEDDERLDFRPHKLRLGTQTENGNDAHNNGKYDETNTVRMKCTSYIKDVFEKEHISQHEAVKYLKSLDIKYKKASQGKISMVLSGDRKTAYGRTWKRV